MSPFQKEGQTDPSTLLGIKVGLHIGCYPCESDGTRKRPGGLRIPVWKTFSPALELHEDDHQREER